MRQHLRQRVDSTEVEPEQKSLKVEADDIVNDVLRRPRRDVPIGSGRGSPQRPIHRIEQLNPKAIANYVRPGRHVHPQQLRLGVVVVVEVPIQCEERAPDVADDDDEYEQPVEDVVEYVEWGADDVGQETVVKCHDFVDLEQVYQFYRPASRRVATVRQLKDGYSQTQQIVGQLPVEQFEPLELDHIAAEQYPFGDLRVHHQSSHLVVEVQIDMQQKYDQDSQVQPPLDCPSGLQLEIECHLYRQERENHEETDLHHEI